MIKKLLSQTKIRDLIDSLPEDNESIKWLRLVAKSVLFRRKIYKGFRISWPGLADTRVEKFALLGPGPSEILVRTEFTAVSPGTERQYYLNAPNFHIEYPYIPGYSGAGVVLNVGKDVEEFFPGDRVVGTLKHASLNLVPRDSLALIPESLGSQPASLITLGVIALTAIREAKIKPGQTVAVIGQGMIGQLILALCRLSGAGNVIAIARTDRKRDFSLKTGANEFLSVEKDTEKFPALEADVVFEASGSTQVLSTAFSICKPGSRIILAGSSTAEYASCDTKKELIDKGITLVGAHVRNVMPLPDWFGSYRREAETFLSLLSSGKLQIDHLISRRILPGQAEEMYAAIAGGEASFMGMVIDWISPSLPPLTTRSPTGEAKMVVPGPRKKGKKNLRFALVGCGAIADVNAAAIKAAGGCELIMVMDTFKDAARRLAGKYQVLYTTDFNAVLSDNSLDAIFIAVPHYLHCRLTVEAARAGKHVVVEKPIAMNIAEAQKMIAKCSRHGVMLSVCLPMRYSPAIQQAKSFIGEGGLGEVLGTRMVMLRDRSESFMKRNTWLETNPDWRGDKEKSGGGILMDNVPHYLDYYRYLTGLEVCEVMGLTTTDLLPVNVEDTAQVICRYTNGGLGIINVSSVVRGGGTEENDSINNTIQNLWGSDGQLILYPRLKTFSRKRVSGLSPNRWHKSRLKPAAGLKERTLFLEKFSKAVVTGSPPEITGEDGLQLLAIVEAAYLSSRQNRWVKVKEVLG